MIHWRSFGLLRVAPLSAGWRSRHVRFEISTTVPLPIGEQIFITGNQESLGSWKPDGLPLTRMADNLWAGLALCDASQPLEYKITRGDWATEELAPDGSIPGNYHLEAGPDEVVRHTVECWKDMPLQRARGITGRYRVHQGMHSAYLRFAREVIVWLPPSYEDHPERRYPVCYLQDGQQVFDPQTATANQDWEVDEWCERMIAAGEMEEIIAVAVASTEDRLMEYDPTQAGSAYARFLVSELKPWVDREYRTRPEAAATAVAGASLGGTLAFWLAWNRPDVFGAAVCLSPAFRFHDNAYCLDQVRQAAQPPAIRVFLYCGMGDATERELMEGVYEMVRLLRQQGFQEGVTLSVIEDAEGRHHEASWAKHTSEWLRFLYGKRGNAG